MKWLLDTNTIIHALNGVLLGAPPAQRGRRARRNSDQRGGRGRADLRRGILGPLRGEPREYSAQTGTRPRCATGCTDCGQVGDAQGVGWWRVSRSLTICMRIQVRHETLARIITHRRTFSPARAAGAGREVAHLERPIRTQQRLSYRSLQKRSRLGVQLVASEAVGRCIADVGVDAGIQPRKLDQIGSAKFFALRRLSSRGQTPQARDKSGETTRGRLADSCHHRARKPQSRRKCNCRPETCLATRRRISATLGAVSFKKDRTRCAVLVPAGSGSHPSGLSAQGTF